jgi:hypothetical protein
MHPTLVVRPAHLVDHAQPEPETNIRDARGWARDLAIVGMLTGAIVPLLLGASLALSLLAALVAAALGALVGLAAPLAFHRRVRRMPVVLLAGAGAGLGGLWGGATASLAALLATGEVTWVRAAELGATAGMIQLGAFWLPALLLRARGRSTRPAHLLALALLPAIAGYLALAC